MHKVANTLIVGPVRRGKTIESGALREMLAGHAGATISAGGAAVAEAIRRVEVVDLPDIHIRKGAIIQRSHGRE